ncbi:MAG: NUDIX domain-containing protein [Chitinivibrionales bacterium]|nr:NUDIX domain-containing protein [Chitinivibrionales bacterium]
MIKVKFYEPNEVDDTLLFYAVIVTLYRDEWILVKHKSRSTWEIPGGRREKGEHIVQTAERELNEETGAAGFCLEPICPYSVINGCEESFGFIYYTKVLNFGGNLLHEIGEVKLFHTLPKNLTYPTIQPALFEMVIQRKFPHKIGITECRVPSS